MEILVLAMSAFLALALISWVLVKAQNPRF